MMNKKKNLLVKTVFMGVLLLSILLPTFADSASRGLPYLHIVDALNSDVSQFNEKGVAVDPTDPPQALGRGWTILTGFDPVVIKNRNVTILVQQESILSIVSDKADNLKFYLVAGSASFFRDKTFIEKMSINTPIGLYEVMGPGEVFVSSDVSELIFSLGSTVKVTNAITRKRTILSPYHYLDLADPFLKEKQISKQTYNTLSINPEENRSSLLPSATVTDGIKITTIESVQTPPPVKEEVETPKVEAPKVEAPKVEAPKVETPKVEAPKVETPKVETPKVETPKEETPKVETPKEEAPKEEAPKVKVPIVALPVINLPRVTEPRVTEPKVVEPKVVEPKVAEPEVTEPVADESVAAEPVADEPVAAEPKAAEPVVAEPVVAEPKVTEPVATEPVVEPVDEVFNVYIIHTNDALGALNDSAIPYPTFATLLTWNENVHPRTLLVDAGNSLSGSEIANMNKGLDAATLYQTLGYDAISPSTAEYAFGINRLIEGAEISKENNYLDVLAANVTDKSGDILFTPYSIYDLDGFSVGVIGLSFPEQDIEGISLYPENYVTRGQLLVDEVASKADYVVLLGNLTPSSVYTAEQIASNISGIDLIIDGKYGSGLQEVDSTLIVQAGEKLTSVGVVELTIVNDTVDAVSSFVITKDDVASPENSALAQSFNISSIPEDEKVAAFLDSLNQSLLAAKETEVEPTQVETEEPVADVAVEEVEEEEATPQLDEEVADVAVEEVEEETTPQLDEEVVDVAVEEEQKEEVSPLAIQPQQGITTSATPPAPKNEFGVKTSFIATKTDVLENNDIKVGLSVNPYLQIKKLRLGLQAFYLTDGSLFDPFGASSENLNIESGLLGTVRSSLRFIDYFYYGEAGDNLFIQMDDVTPITFNNGFIINNYTPTGGPANENMGLYSSMQIGIVGIQTFFDDMYLTNLYAGNTQNAALRFSFDVGSAFEVGVGSVINTNSSFDDVTLYPTVDASWLVKNTRTFQLSLFGGATTSVDAAPFSITPMYNSAGAGFSSKFPNFQVTGGIEMNTPKWNISLIGSAFNASDPLMVYGSINDSYYSGQRIIQDTGIQLLAGISTKYSSDRFGFDISYYIPFEQNFSTIIPLNAFPTRTGDNLIVGISYTGDYFSAKAGLRKYGVISSVSELFAFDDGFSGFLNDASSFINEAGIASPYISGTYTSGPFSLYADLSFLQDGKSNLTIGSSIDLGSEIAEAAIRKEKNDEALSYSFDIGTSYTRLFASGPDENYLSITPLLTMSKSNFSFGIGPQITFDADAADLYYHFPTSPFSFGSGLGGRFAPIFDIATDLFGLVDHFQIGNSDGTNYLSINKNQTYSMGTLIRSMDTAVDGTLQNKLSMVTKIDTKVLDIDLFVNDLTSFQLSSMRIGISPFKKWAAELNLSGIVSTKLEASDKQLDVVTTLDGTLPLLNKENSSIALYGGFSTLVGFDTTNGITQMLYNSSVPEFLGRFNNYLLSAGVLSTFDKFTLNVIAATQEGAISLGMYNSFYTREREDIIDSFDDQWTDISTSTGRTYSASVETSYEGKAIDVHASYMLPLTSSFTLIETEDLLNVGMSVDVKNFKIGLEYARRGFLDATKTFLGSTDSIVDRTKTFVLNNDSLVGVTLGVQTGNVDLNAKIGTYTSFSSDGSYNGTTIGTTTPMITLGAHINIF